MNDKLTLQIFAFDCNAISEEQHDNALKAIKKFGASLRASGRMQRVSGVRFTRNEEVMIKDTPLEKFKISKMLVNDGTGACQMLDRSSEVMDKVGIRLADTPEEERPSQVIMTIIVSGRDNASVRCTYERLREMIALQRDVYKWKFFLMTDFTINMEKLGIAEDDTIIIKRSEKDMFERPFAELTEKIIACFPKEQ